MNQAQKERYAENYGVVLVPEETSARVFNDVDSFKGRCPEILQEIEEKITDYARNYAEDEQDIRMKTNALNKLQAFIRDIFPEAILKQVGSTITKLSTKKSDMDLCLVVRDGNGEFDQSHSFALHTLQVLYDELCDERPDMISFHKFIDSAVVPIVKIYLNDEFADLEVDINCNVLPVFLSNHLVLHYVTFDPRVQPLILAIKRWAKNLQVSASQKGGLNSFSFVMMAIHFLQSVCFPMILPNFWKMFPHTFDDNAPVNLRRDLSHDRCIPPMTNMMRNDRSIAELFLGFISYYSRFDWDQHAIVIRAGCLANRCEVYEQDEISAKMYIEEPYDRFNTARTVRRQEDKEAIIGKLRSLAERVFSKGNRDREILTLLDGQDPEEGEL